MQVLKSIIIGSLMIVSTVYAGYAPEPIVEETVIKTALEYRTIYTKEEILPIVTKIADKYNVSAIRMMYTIEAESNFSNVQSSCYKNEYTNCGSYGVREESYGLAQFNVSTLPKEQALDIYIAIDRMAYYFSIGEACRWTEYRKKYGCNI